MAFTDVINTTGAIFQVYPELVTYLGNAAGDPPPATSPTAFDGVHAVRVVQSASGSRLDFVQLQNQLTASLENRTQPANFTRMVAVHLPDTGATRIHLGDLVEETVGVDMESESLTTQSQLRPYHFGGVVEGYRVYDPISDTTVVIEDDITFNPVIDNVTRGNRSTEFEREPSGHSYYMWTHPEVIDNTAGEVFYGHEREEWTLQQAVESVCGELNGRGSADQFIDNPISIVGYNVLASAPPIRNVTIPVGARLPQALDSLTIPFGFNWYVDYTQLVAGDNPVITFFEIGVGDEKELKMQAAGSTLDLELSNINQFEISNAIGDSFNEVLALGEFHEAEVTIPLYAGWSEAGDAIDRSDLAKDGDQYIGNEAAWRLFIANEAADIDPTKSRLGSVPDVPDFSQVFSKAVPHRRVLGEPLTYLDGKDTAGRVATPTDIKPQRRPIFLEWSDDGGTTWKPEEETWTVKLCPDQIGVLFDNKEVPQELYDAGDQLRMRITGTIFGDVRLQGLATKETHSANGRTIRQVLDVPDKFHKRWREIFGTFTSQLYLTSNDADERDDTDAILEYAENIRDKNHHAEIDCEFRLPGWHTEYKIGDLITKIAGREISLDAAASTSPDNRYVQIVERIFEMSASSGPATILVVDRGISQARTPPDAT